MKLKHVPALLIICLLSALLPARAFAEPMVYKPAFVQTVKDNKVNELGGVLVKFAAGRLQKNDFVTLRLPDGFIWTTKDEDAGKNAAFRAVQSSEQWNTLMYDFDSIRYGTKNYVLVPSKYCGIENGFYKGDKPVFSFAALNEREVRMEIIEEMDPLRECCFYLYPERIFVAWGYEGDIVITVDIPDSPDLVPGSEAGAGLQCPEAGTVYAGLRGQKIGAIELIEGAAGQAPSGASLTLQLPAGARWEKLSESGDNNLKAAGSISGDGRTAEFKFTGPSSAPASLRFEDMEVFVAPELKGGLRVREIGRAHV